LLPVAVAVVAANHQTGMAVVEPVAVLEGISPQLARRLLERLILLLLVRAVLAEHQDPTRHLFHLPAYLDQTRRLTEAWRLVVDTAVETKAAQVAKVVLVVLAVALAVMLAR
jgi:hypothetical protein